MDTFYVEREIMELYVRNNIIPITGELTHSQAELTIGLLSLYLVNGSKKITLYFCNAMGGSYDSCVAISDEIDALKEFGVTFETLAAGKVCSAHALLFLKGDKRKIRKNAELMLHEVSEAKGVIGGQNKIKQEAKRLEKENDFIINIIAMATGKDKKQIKKDIGYAHYFNLNQAIKYGLAHEISTDTLI